ncbi:hypothetical protein TNCV_3605541 [Trichonephila clavipes]|uniref:Uncharacterized protein n=1 Tax=Trichonephila clavipes TaxID=2585209 RepID=A0A8X6RJ40_TRICX|nr:hypothetical protein TNCV_3605541 [Trichonephila clavipes]
MKAIFELPSLNFLDTTSPSSHDIELVTGESFLLETHSFCRQQDASRRSKVLALEWMWKFKDWQWLKVMGLTLEVHFNKLRALIPTKLRKSASFRLPRPANVSLDKVDIHHQLHYFGRSLRLSSVKVRLNAKPIFHRKIPWKFPITRTSVNNRAFLKISKHSVDTFIFVLIR